jgi:hypothetical protein
MPKKTQPLTPYLRVPPLLGWLALALLAGGGYLVAAWLGGEPGFPLDDAWIHQTYARNLAQTGQFAFTPGLPSTGSTAPLWTLLLSVGYLLGLPYAAWSYGLGIALLGLTGWTMARLARRLFPREPRLGAWAGLFCVLEWHLGWAAVSGMETILFVWLSLVVVERYLAWPHEFSDALVVGLLGGMLALTRPEGVLLAGLIGLDMARNWVNSGLKLSPPDPSKGGEKSKIPPFGGPAGPEPAVNLRSGRPRPNRVGLLRRWEGLTIGLLALLLPYVAFHLYLTGLPFPNTFYAKQAEYGAMLGQFPLGVRLFGPLGSPPDSMQGVFRVVFVGAQVLLLPGLIYAAWLTFKEKRGELALIWTWWLGYLLLYGLRLPVTYQHGRYQIPAIVWLVLLGAWGTARLLKLIPPHRTLVRASGRALVIALAVLTVAFWGVGATAYARDVRIINGEMVTTARWLAENTPPTALIAAHDIGAMGYFAQRPLIDLAGLVSPEVIPVIRNEAALGQLLQTRQAEYLVTFPAWYPALTQSPQIQLIYTTGSPDAPLAGGENMAVYRLLAGPQP